jgi:hypothetical protein
MPFTNDLPEDFVPKIGEWSSSGDRHDSTKRNDLKWRDIIHFLLAPLKGKKKVISNWGWYSLSQQLAGGPRTLNII